MTGALVAAVSTGVVVAGALVGDAMVGGAAVVVVPMEDDEAGDV